MTLQHPAFDFLPVSTPPDEKRLLRIGSPYFLILERMNGLRIADISESEHSLVIYFVLSGGTEQKILKQVDNANMPDDFPVMLLAHSNHNSLPAALEILARLQQTGRKGRIVYLNNPEDTAGLEQLSIYIKLLTAHLGMQSARMGLIGKPSGWLVASSPDFDTINHIWGPQVVEIDFNDYFQHVLQADSAKNLESLGAFISGATHITGPDQTDFKKSLDIYTGLQEVVEEHKLDALSVRCFDLVTRHQATGCYALSQLNDDRVVAGCEGDLVSTVGMLWARHLLKAQAWMANPARIDQQNNKLWLAHCTIALGMTKRYELLTHFESDLGIGIRGTVVPQPCTLFRIGGTRLNSLWIAEGNILQSGNSSHLCRTQLEIELKNPEAIAQLLAKPLGNHLILVFGYHRNLLESYHELFIKQD